MLATLYGVVSLALHVLVLGTAVVWGRRPERLAALILTSAMVGTITLQNRSFDGVDLQLATLDALQLVALFVIAVATGRRWIFFACAFTLLSLIVHGARWLLGTQVTAFPYLTVYAVLSYAVVTCLAFGTISALRQRHKREATGLLSVSVT